LHKGLKNRAIEGGVRADYHFISRIIDEIPLGKIMLNFGSNFAYYQKNVFPEVKSRYK
jgi:hypothetical protein